MFMFFVFAGLTKTDWMMRRKMVDVRVEVTAELQLGKEETALGMKNFDLTFSEAFYQTKMK